MEFAVFLNVIYNFEQTLGGRWRVFQVAQVARVAQVAGGAFSKVPEKVTTNNNSC